MKLSLIQTLDQWQIDTLREMWKERMEMTRLFLVFLKPILNNEDARRGLRRAEETGGVILMRKTGLGGVNVIKGL